MPITPSHQPNAFTTVLQSILEVSGQLFNRRIADETVPLGERRSGLQIQGLTRVSVPAIGDKARPAIAPPTSMPSCWLRNSLLRLAILLQALSLSACMSPSLIGASSQVLSPPGKITQLVMLGTEGPDTPRAISTTSGALSYRLSERLKARGVSVSFYSLSRPGKGRPADLGQYLKEANATHFLTVHIPSALVEVGSQGGKVVYELAKKFPLEVHVHAASSGQAVWRFSAYVDASRYLQTISGLEKDVEAAMQADGLL